MFMKIVFFALFSIVTIPGIFSLGNKEKRNNPQNQPITGTEIVAAPNQADTGKNDTVKIIGKIQIYGNEPFTFVGIIDQDKIEYAV